MCKPRTEAAFYICLFVLDLDLQRTSEVGGHHLQQDIKRLGVVDRLVSAKKRQEKKKKKKRGRRIYIQHCTVLTISM
jgi:hypothetical protein